MIQIKKIDGLTGRILKDCVCGKYEPLNERHSKCKWCHGEMPNRFFPKSIHSILKLKN